MGVLTPWFLSALALLGLPFWLHLLKRHRSEPQPFSSLMFFEKSMQADLRHRRLDYLLLLALRLLLLALVVWAFAQPFLKRAAGAGAAARRLVVVDVSASMGYEGRMERARAGASALMNEGARLAVFDTRLRMVPAAEIGNLKAGTARSSLGELARALRAIDEAEKRPLEVHLFSDLQRSSMPPGFSDLALGAHTRLVLHEVDKETRANWGVESVEAPARVPEAKGARVRATLAGYHTPAAKRTAVLEINGQPAGRQAVEVAANGKARVEFSGFELPYGFAKGRVRIEERDGLEADNARWFAIERAEPQKVLFLTGAQAGASANFFPNALQAAAPGAYQVEVRGVGEAQDAAGAAFVVVSDAGAFDDAGLKRYVRQGGAALVVLGAASVARGKAPIVELAVRASRYSPAGAERYRTLGTADESSPLVSKADHWRGARFYQSIDVDAGAAHVVARFSDQTPALLEMKVGEGTVLVLASALDNVASDFPSQPSFVAFAEQVAARLTSKTETAREATVDTALAVGVSGGVAPEVLTPLGKPAMSREELVSGKPVTLDRPGLWSIQRAGGRVEMIAVNVDGRESDLDPMSEDSARMWAAARPGAAGGGSGGAGEERYSLSPWLLAAAVLAAAGEALVAARHLRKEAA